MQVSANFYQYSININLSSFKQAISRWRRSCRNASTSHLVSKDAGLISPFKFPLRLRNGWTCDDYKWLKPLDSVVGRVVVSDVCRSTSGKAMCKQFLFLVMLWYRFSSDGFLVDDLLVVRPYKIKAFSRTKVVQQKWQSGLLEDDCEVFRCWVMGALVSLCTTLLLQHEVSFATKVGFKAKQNATKWRLSI